MLTGPEEAVKVLAERCHKRGTLLGAIRVAYDCPDVLPRSVVTKAFTEFAHAKDHNLCRHAGPVAEELSRPLLSKVLAPPPASTVSQKCVEAHQDCGRDFLCTANVKASASMGLSQMLQETAKLCTSKDSMLRALTVAAECPGAYHSAEAHVLRRSVEQTKNEDLCRSVSQLLPEVPGQLLTGKPLPSTCLAAHRRCGADAMCSAAVGRMVRSSASVQKMLDEALGLCEHKQAMLLAMEVSYECPGMLPPKEARESHHALAMVPQHQLCGKMKELTQVMGVLLSPMPSQSCRDAKRKCGSSTRCAKAQATAHGDEKAMMTEALAMCDDKDAMMLTLDVGEHCEQHSQVLHQARAALNSVAPAKLCDESKSFMERLGSNPFQLDATASMAATTAPIACTLAQNRCGASKRCSSAASEIDALSRRSAASNGQMLEILKLCGNRADFFAALDIAAECPGNSLQGQMRALQQSLRSAPESSLCFSAMTEARNAALASSPLAVPPVACVRAHSACSTDSECSEAVQKPAGSESFNLAEEVMNLCGKKHSFLRAMQVAVECPGPQAQDVFRSAASSLTNVPEDQLCDRAGALLLVQLRLHVEWRLRRKLQLQLMQRPSRLPLILLQSTSLQVLLWALLLALLKVLLSTRLGRIMVILRACRG